MKMIKVQKKLSYRNVANINNEIMACDISGRVVMIRKIAMKIIFHSMFT